MNIPKTTGYTEIVKIAESALCMDRDKAIKYINKFIIKFPESDLVYPFTHLLKDKKNPSGLGHGDIIHSTPTCLPSDEDVQDNAEREPDLNFDEEMGYILGAKWMRSIASSRIAEMENISLKDRLFKLANDFAVAKQGDIAVQLHKIHNSITTTP